MADASPNFFFGFLMALLAGMATVLGVAFVPLIKYSKVSEVTATSGALAFAAGVMMWVAFVDVLGGHAQEFFNSHFAAMSDSGDHSGHDHSGHDHVKAAAGHGENETEVRLWIALFFFIGMGATVAMDAVIEKYFGHVHGHGHDGGEETNDHADVHVHTHETTKSSLSAMLQMEIEKGDVDAVQESVVAMAAANESMSRASLVAMLALAMHNFPEGLATFFDGANGGFAVAIAISLHNVPVGAAIALPAYQSSGYRAAFKACILTGLSQPAGAVFGWLLVVILGAGYEVPTFAYGALYAMTAGVMIGVVLAGLMPEALERKSSMFVSLNMMAGFLVMEGSLIILSASGAHSH